MPVVPVQAPVLNCFGQMLGADTFTTVEIGDGTGHFEDPVVGASGKAHAAHGHLKGSLAGFVQRAEFAQMADGDVGVVKAPDELKGANPFHSRADLRRGSAVILPAQFLIRDRWNFDVQIDPIEQGAADFSEITLDDPARAAALPGRIAEKSARTPVQLTTDRT